MIKVKGKERRQDVRSKRVLTIAHKISSSRQNKPGQKAHLSATQDMSLGGLAFYTTEQYKMGDVVDLHVTMSGILDIFHGKAKVVRLVKQKSAGKFLVGVQFLKSATKARPARSFTKKKSLRNATQKKSVK